MFLNTPLIPIAYADKRIVLPFLTFLYLWIHEHRQTEGPDFLTREKIVP